MPSKRIRKNIKHHSASLNKRTLDIQHSGRLTEFSKSQEEITQMKSKIKNIEDQLSMFKEKQRNGYDASEDEILRMIALQDEKDLLCKNLQENYENDEVEYLINTAPILFQYYDIVEKGNDEQTLVDTKDNILKYFVKSEENSDKANNRGNDRAYDKANDRANDRAYDKANDKDVDIAASIEPQYNDRATLLNKYMLLTDENYVKNVELESRETCVHCNSANRNVMLNEGFIHCNDCDSIEYIIIDHDRPSYKEIPREVTYFSYKRINHLNELIIIVLFIYGS